MRALVAATSFALIGLVCAGAQADRRRAAPEAAIAFVAGEEGYVYVAVPGRPTRRLTRGRDWGAQTVTWSPDGTRLAVVSDNAPDDYVGTVYTIGLHGAHRRRLTLLKSEEAQLRWRARNRIDVLTAVWPDKTRVTTVGVERPGRPRTRVEPAGVLSPDGSFRARVATSYRHDGELVVAPRGGGRAVTLGPLRSVGPARLRVSAPTWSRSGNRLAFALDRGRGPEIWTIRVDSGRLRRVIGAPRLAAGPEWSPDGRLIAYAADVDDDGIDELYVVHPDGTGQRRLASGVYIQAFAWRPSPAPAPEERSLTIRHHPPLLVRTSSWQLAKGRFRLTDLRVLRRFPSDLARPTLADISPDGSLVAFYDRAGLQLLDLRAGSTTRVAPPPVDLGRARFSLGGRYLAYRRRRRLVVRDLASGVERVAARSRWGAFGWLRGGRLAFVGDRGRVKVVVPGRRPHAIPGVPLVDRFAFSPDGRRLLYDRACKTYLFDRRTHATRRLSGHMFVPDAPWAADATYFVLQWAEECTKGGIWAYHSWDALYASDGRKVAETGGRDATWSHHGRLLFVYPIQTGTETAGTQAISVIEPRRRRESSLLGEGNAYNQALVGPGSWVVFAKYDRPDLVSDFVTSGAVYVARLRARGASR